jgi:replication-associated recombination protein RarA
MQTNPHLRTKHNYDAYEVVSALHKCIRRGMEEDALYWAYELAKSPNKNHYSWLWQRLKIIASEDIGPADPGMPILIDVLYRNWKAKKACDLWYTNAVIALVRSSKSRIVDNAVNMMLTKDALGRWENKPIPEECVVEANLERAKEPNHTTRKNIPGFAMDMHTPAGKRAGLGKRDFYDEGAKLASCKLPDPYEDRARAGDLELEKQREKETRRT